GDHLFVFSLPGSASVEQRAVIRPGERDRDIHVAFPKSPPPPPAVDAAPPLPPTRPVPLTTWVFGGIGLVALGVSADVGASALWGDPGVSTLRSCKGHCS